MGSIDERIDKELARALYGLWKQATAWKNKKTHPGAKLTKKERSRVVRKAVRGQDVCGGGFEKVKRKAKQEYGSEEKARRVAAAVMWKILGKRKKKG